MGEIELNRHRHQSEYDTITQKPDYFNKYRP